MDFVLGAILLVLAVALIALVLAQPDKDKRLSGTIAGGADTFYGKNSGKGSNKKLLSAATIVVAVLFTVLVVVMYLVV